MSVAVAYIGVGSNLNDPALQVRRALVALQALSDAGALRASSLYQNPPLGPEQPDYVNAVAELMTTHTPWALLTELHAIERAHGRVRDESQRWGPRILDLDLLLFGNEVLDTPTLHIPHPGLSQRRFVLQPLLELNPHVEAPGLGALAAWLERCPEHPLQRLVA